MSSSTRTSSKGKKGVKSDKSHKTDKTDTASGDKQLTNRDNSKSEENMKIKVQQLIEMTERSEEEVCLALQECNFDVNQAINYLFETMLEGEWSVKKKKSRQPGSKQDQKTDETSSSAIVDEWNENSSPTSASANNDKEKTRSKSGGPSRVHGRHNDSRGWRGRERHENDRNAGDDGGRSSEFPRGERRGRSGGSNRGGGGGRGRGGGRAGGRYPPRGNRGGGGGSNTYNKPIDTWDNNNSNTWDNSTVANTTNTAEENWDDFPGPDEWSTEEYTGSLADTKVFTPSSQVPLEPPIENQHLGPLDAASQQLGQTLQINQQQQQQQPACGGPLPPNSQNPAGGGPIVGTLNAAQTQYLNQLTQQNSDKYGSMQTSYPGGGGQTYEKTSPSTAYNASQPYGSAPANSYANASYPVVAASYGTNADQGGPTQPTRAKTQRARVPPPSKIPSSAVEMPGDLNSSIGYLDVQFGAMDFMSDSSSFDGVADQKYGSSNASTLDTSATAATAATLDLNSSQTSNLDAYSPKTNTQSSISSALSQSLSNTDNIPTSEHLAGTGSYNTRSSTVSSATQSASQSALDISKQTDANTYNQSSNYNSYQSKNTYNPSAYSAAQTTAGSYPAANSYVNSQTGGSYAGSTANAYQNSYSSATSYQSNSNPNAFPSITQANSYSSTANPSSYTQNTSQSVYGANTGLNNTSSYGNTSSTNQYNNYSSSANHKLVKESSPYDSTNAVSSTQSTTTNNATASSAALSLSQTTVSGSKTTTTLAAKNSNVVSNMPPGVTPVLSTPYNMVQVPYFQQPVYSYEDMQLLQQRLPHMTTPYYDMSYQTTPTTLAAVRDAATLGNVGYSMSTDGRYTRSDNNASPVPSTLSQQTSTLTQGHQAQPILAAGTAAAPSFYFATPFNTIPNYPFYQLPATNAHGTNNSTQYGKPGAYGSGYGSYDTLGQTQDYGKTTYVSNTQGQKGAGVNASSTSSGNDLSAMYGKSHAALGKVNSYEKQGFHSGTPPPFTGALHGSQNAGMAPSGTGYAPPVYIPTMAPHQQHHSTQLMHQPLHQMDVRHQGRRVDSGNSTGQRSQASNQAKAGGKQYPSSYWNQA